LQRADVIEKVNKVLVEGFEIDLAKLKPEAHLYHDLGIDSLDAVDMLVYLEEQTGMQVKGEWFKSVRRLNDIYNVMEAVLNGRTPDAGEAATADAPAATPVGGFAPIEAEGK
jgi:acyl carrier protein